MSGYRQRGAQLWRTVVLSAVSALVLGTFVVPATPAAAVGPLPQAATAPAAPTSVKATPGNMQAVVTWVAPANGGSAITGYTVTSSPDGITATTTGAKTATLVGLTNGTAYTFTVTATNAIGTGPASAPSAAVIPAAPPGAPTSVTATPGNTKAVVTWTAPTVNGGSAITGYTVTASPGGKTATSTGATTATVTGLINGTAYTFMVTAKNAVSTGPSSTPSAAITPAGPPAAPTSVTATAGNASASVSWVAPSDNGGSTITGYTVTSSPGGKTATTTGDTSATVLALTNGTAYTFTVKATTSGGTSVASAASLAVTPTGLPGAPTSVAAAASDGQATVAWNAPASTGGLPITAYTVTASPGGFTATTTGGTTATVVGLTDGTAYTFSVVATNANGPGPTSTASGAVTPLGPPSAPTAVSAVPGNAKAVVSWTAPSSNGGSAITGYTVTASPGGQTVTAGAAATSATMTGLTNGTAYTFTVTAKNARVTGAASAPSAAVTPAAPPGAATGVTAVAGNGQATVSWVAPASDGGSPIIKYTVTSTPGGLVATTSGATNVVVTGLTNGTSYTFKVVAANAVSSGAASAASAAVVPVGSPGAPSNVAAVPGNGQAKVSWSKPASNGGSTITAYTVTASPGGQTATTTGATSATITGLTNGIAYTFTVTATNAQGTSGSSVASAPVTPAMLPGAPTGVSGISRDASVAVSWTAPASNGGSPITGYTVTATPGGSKTTTNGATNAVVTGLTNGTAYTFKVTATNAIGTGPSSAASASVTPLGPPGAPTGVTATAGNGNASVSWTPPVATGGAPITGYTILVSPDGTQATVGNVTSAVVAGLTNGTAYTFTVEATNRVGTGIASAPSASVTPAGPPSAPTDVAAVASDSQATVSWTPAAANGSPITQYTVTVDPGGATVTTGGTPDAVITGLTDGTEYTFTVTATNALGTSPASSPSAPVLPGGFTIPLTHGVARISASTNGADTSVLAVSNNGRYSLFASQGQVGANVVVHPLATCGCSNLYLRDNSTGNVTQVATAFAFFLDAAISDDGRYITYREGFYFSGESFVAQFDVVTGSTTDVFSASGGQFTDRDGANGADMGVSADGRYAVIQADDTSGNCPNQSQPVVWDRTTGVSTTLPICTNGALAMSADGSTIASYAYDQQGNDEVFAWNRSGAVLGEVSVGRANAPLVVNNGNSLSLSANGNDVAFTATVGADGSFENAPFFGGGYGNAVAMRDLSAGFTSAVPYPRTNSFEYVQASSPSVSADGQHVAFVFLAGQSNEDGGNPEVLVTNMHTGTEQQADVTSTLALPNGGTQRVVLSGNARYIEFSSYASNIVPGDNNGNADVFLRDLTTIPPVVPAGELRPGDAFCPVCQATAARLDPINTATGAYENKATDVSLPGAGVNFNLVRQYSSDDTSIGDFGIGWQANLTANITVLPDGDAQMNAGTGAAVIFHAQPDGTFVAPPEVRAKLTKESDGTWNLTTTAQDISIFDSSGSLIKQVDSTGLGLTYLYDAGKLASVTDAEGRTATFTRGVGGAADGLITGVTLSDGRSWSYGYAYGPDGTTAELTSATDPSGATTTYAYDASNRLATVTDPNGHQTVAVSYDGDGRVSSMTEAASGTPGSYSWNANTGTAVTTDANGGTWTDTYVGNELISATDPLGATTQYLYDSAGNKTAITDPDGNTTSYTHDANGNVLTQTDALGNVTTYTYDANNNLLSQTDPMGRTTSYSYNSQDQRTSETDPAGNIQRWTYTPSGQVATATNANGGVTSYVYDADENVVSKTDPMGRVTTYTYDSSGNELTETDPMGRVTTSTYDSLNRLLTTTDPIGRESVYTYDAAGNIMTVTAAAGTPQAATTTNTYDAANRLIATADPLGRVTTNTYDAVGNLTSTTDPAGDVTSYIYDLAGHRIGDVAPNGNMPGADATQFTTISSFDPAGRQVGSSTPLGAGAVATTSSTYDANGRTLSTTDADGNVTAHTYDADGELLTTTDPAGGVTTRTYDVLGNNTSSTDPLGRTTTYTYDASGNRVSVTDPTGAQTTSTYDGDNERITQVAPDGYADGASAADFTTTYGYDSDGKQTSVTDPLGHVTSSTYDADGEQTRTTDATGAATTYGYDDAGNLTVTTNTDGTTTNDTYDLAGELVSSADGNGNTTTSAYDADGRVLSTTDPIGAVTTSTYDADGNVLTSTSPNGGVTTNVYDPADRLTSSTGPTGGVTSYTYDAIGKQTSTTDPDGNKTVTTYDADGRTTATTRADGTVATSTYDAAGELLTFTQPYDAAPGATPTSTVAAPAAAPAAPAAPSDPSTVAVTAGPNAIAASWVAPAAGAPTDYTVTVTAGSQLIGAMVVAGSATTAVITGLPASTGDIVTVQPGGGGTPMVSGTLSVTGSSSTYSSQVLADAPGVYYRLGDGVGADGAADLSGHGDTATAPSTGLTFGQAGAVATDADTSSGVAGGSLQETSGANLPVGNADRSIEAWFATSATTNQVIAQWGAASTGELSSLEVAGGNQVVFDADGETATFTTPMTLADGLFHHVVVAYNSASSTVAAYVDGQLVSGQTLTSPLATTLTSSGLTIGADGAGANGFVGSLDEVAVYPVALTPARVQAHYAAAHLAGLSTTSYTYDGAGRKASETDPDGRVTQYGYDASGNLTSATDAASRVTTQTFDDAGRLTGIAYSDGLTPNVSFSYDAAGRRLSMHDGTGTTSYSYNTATQLTKVVDGAGQAVGYSYNALGQVDAIGYPDGRSVTRAFDAAGRLTSVTDWNAKTTTFGYDGDSNVISTTLPNGVVSTTTVDAADQTTGITVASGSNSLASFGYTHSPGGQQTATTDSLAPVASTTFGYSPRNQLVGTGSDTAAYGYDGSGNLTGLGDGSALSYDPAGELTSSQGAGAETSYAFDAVGDRTGEVAGSAHTSYSYDQAERLTSVSTGSSTSGYTYNGDGLRASTTVGTSTAPFGWDTLTGSVSLLLTDGANDYVYGPADQPFEQAPTGPGSPTFLSADSLGSVRLITDASGSAVGSYSYGPYGAVLTHTGSADSALGYTGQYTDPTGLVYLRARFYDPATAQFLTVDPALDSTRQPYAYAAGDPTLKTDPTGKRPCELVPGIPPAIRAAENAAKFIEDHSPVFGRHKAKASDQLSNGINEARDVYNDFFNTTDYVNRGPGYFYCFGLDGCLQALPYAEAHEKDKQAIQTIAATYCIVHAVRCQHDSSLDHSLNSLFSEFDWLALAGIGAAELPNETGTPDDGSGDGAMCGGESFTAGTGVVMADGTTKRLDQIKVGDKVEAFDPKSGHNVTETVTTLWVNDDNDLMDVTIYASGTTAVIHATQHHLFWDLTRHGWVEADHLHSGDRLLTDDGSTATVASTEIIPGAADMWDLTITTTHDFYIVTDAADILVHNDSCDVPRDERVRLTTPQATDMAKRVGYKPTNYKSKGQVVFTNGKTYITQDIDAHAGGLWKMAKTPDGFGSRIGTFDYNLNYVGP